MQLAATLEHLPLLRAPTAWPTALVAGSAMLVLAVLDFAGAVAAKEWAEDGSPRWLAFGVVCFVVLFYVYASSLRYAELALVTMGWIVLLQVGILVLDQVRYGATLPTGKWLAVGAILLLQGYLVLAPSPSAAAGS